MFRPKSNRGAFLLAVLWIVLFVPAIFIAYLALYGLAIDPNPRGDITFDLYAACAALSPISLAIGCISGVGYSVGRPAKSKMSSTLGVLVYLPFLNIALALFWYLVLVVLSFL